MFMSTDQENRAAFIASLRKSEGYSDMPYRDTMGYYTVGWGHKLGMHVKKAALRQYTRDELEELFQADVETADTEASSIMTRNLGEQHLDTAVWYTLVEMCFCMGEHGTLGFHDCLKALAANDIPTAIAELRDSLWHHEAPHRVEKLCSRLESGTV